MKTIRPIHPLCLLAALLLLAVTGLQAKEYKFKVHNTSGELIKKVLVSEDGKEYGYFDIGAGIKANDTVELVWDKSTNNGKCKQYFKAVFASGEESKAVQFDFCEEDLVLEF